MSVIMDDVTHIRFSQPLSSLSQQAQPVLLLLKPAQNGHLLSNIILFDVFGQWNVSCYLFELIHILVMDDAVTHAIRYTQPFKSRFQQTQSKKALYCLNLHPSHNCRHFSTQP